VEASVPGQRQILFCYHIATRSDIELHHRQADFLNITHVCYEFPNIIYQEKLLFNPLNAELNPICYLLALLGAHHFIHVSRIRVKSLTLRQLMSYIYGAPILDVSRSHTTTQHSR